MSSTFFNFKYRSALVLFGIIYFINTEVCAHNYLNYELVVQTNQRVECSISIQSSSPSLDPFFDQYSLQSIVPLSYCSFPENEIITQSQSSPQTFTYHLKFSSPINLETIIDDFEKHPMVIHVQPNYIYTVQSIPNDPFFSQQWYLNDLDLEDAWAFTKGSADTVVAVIDTGVDWEHPDLEDNIWTNSDESINGLDDDGNGFIDDVRGWDFNNNDNNPTDDHHHGTHVAGIISAVGDNNIGIYSVSPASRIMPLKAGSQTGKFSTTSLSNSIQYAVSNQADIINLSLGGVLSGNKDDSVLKQHIQSALDNNVVVVAAAGNIQANLDNTYFIPAVYPGLIVVSALGNNGQFESNYSNYGSQITVAAPGGNYNSLNFQEAILSTLPVSLYTNQYGASVGTSMAAPIVSGIAALAKSIDPQLSTANLIEAIKQSAKDINTPGFDPETGHGLIQAHALLSTLDIYPPTINHTFSNSLNTTDSVNISATITDSMSKSQTSGKIHYRFVSAGSPTSDWLSSSLTNNYPSYLADITVPFGQNISQINYYFSANDVKQNSTLLPSNAPTSFFTASLNDTVGPAITFQQINGDFISIQTPIQISIADFSTIISSSIQANVTQGSVSQTYAISDSELNLSNNTLSLDLSESPFSSGDPIQIKITAKDNLNNNTEKTLEIFESSVFKVTGPRGENTPYNAPNPFNPSKESTFFSYQLSHDASVEITVYDFYLTPVFNTQLDQLTGYHEVEWNGQGPDGNWLPNGVYIWVLKADQNGQEIIKRNKIAIFR